MEGERGGRLTSRLVGGERCVFRLDEETFGRCVGTEGGGGAGALGRGILVDCDDI